MTDFITLDAGYTNESRRVYDTMCQFIGSGTTLQEFKGVYLAGGAITSIFTGQKVNDLDFYCSSAEERDRLESLLKETYGYKVACDSANAVTLVKHLKKKSYVVQIIKRFYFDTPAECLKSFDFTVVQGLYDFGQGKFVVSDRYFKDLAARKLVYTNTSHYPICALYRTKKYQQRGYSLSGATMIAIALAIHRLQLKTYGDLKDQLMGIDTSMFKEMTDSWNEDKTFEASEFTQEFFEYVYERGIPEWEPASEEDLELD